MADIDWPRLCEEGWFLVIPAEQCEVEGCRLPFGHGGRHGGQAAMRRREERRVQV